MDCDVERPPLAYRFPYPGVVVEQKLSREDMEYMWGANILGFTIRPLVAGGKCFIWIMKGLSKIMEACVREHEHGHCNRWPAHHPKE